MISRDRRYSPNKTDPNGNGGFICECEVDKHATLPEVGEFIMVQGTKYKVLRARMKESHNYHNIIEFEVK